MGAKENAGVVVTSGSAGNNRMRDYLKEIFPIAKSASEKEASQCPTLYLNGFGEHRIEGIIQAHTMGPQRKEHRPLSSQLMTTTAWL